MKIESLKYIFKPNRWYRNYDYCPIWDEVLNKLLDDYEFESVSIDGYRAIIGGVIIWVANHPYASFSDCSNGNDSLPSRLTQDKAYKKYMEFKYKNLI